MFLLWLNKGSVSQAILPPSSLSASAATGGKTRSVLLLLDHLQAIETLIHPHTIENGGRKQVTSTHNYSAMQLESWQGFPQGGRASGNLGGGGVGVMSMLAAEGQF